MNNQEWTIQR